MSVFFAFTWVLYSSITALIPLKTIYRNHLDMFVLCLTHFPFSFKDMIMKSIIPVVMAGVLGIYGLITAVIINGKIQAVKGAPNGRLDRSRHQSRVTRSHRQSE